MVMQDVLTQRVLHTTIAHVAKPSGSGAHTYTQYLVRVSDDRSPALNWTVYRRFSEFRNFKLALDEAVKHGDMCAHCAIMSKRTSFVLFPRRRLFGNLKTKTLEMRRKGLNIFLDAVAKHARTCRESMTCQTRPLMDKFLMVNDMRYTYLNVDMSEARGAEQSSKTCSSERDIHAKRDTLHRSLSMVSRTDRLSGYSDCEDIVRSCTEEWAYSEKDEFTKSLADPKVDQSRDELITTKYSTQEDNQLHLHESRLAAKRNTMPDLLTYINNRHLCRNDNTSCRPSLTTEGECAAYNQLPSGTSTSRHSDPGLSRNELLKFCRGSSTGGGRIHNGENRLRSRKVHLSSAAKRVKRLEEAEARFSMQSQSRKPKCLPRLETIPE